MDADGEPVQYDELQMAIAGRSMIHQAHGDRRRFRDLNEDGDDSGASMMAASSTPAALSSPSTGFRPHSEILRLASAFSYVTILGRSRHGPLI